MFYNEFIMEEVSISRSVRESGCMRREEGTKFRSPNAMRKRIILALLTAMLCLLAPLAIAEGFNPIRISTQAEPQTLTGPQSVTVTIKVVNSGEGNINNPITIFDPNGTQVASWGSLAIGQSQSWQGSWSVTQDQIDAGRLRYSVSYTTYDDDGNAVPTTSTASVTVQKESAAPGLTASYSISPTIAQKDQEVKLTYTLSNTGNVDLTHVRITNTGIGQKNINIASLSVGEKITKEYTFKMGDKNLTSNPKVTYQAKDSDTVLTYAKMAKKTIEVAEGGLEAALSSDQKDEAAKPGDKVTLTLTLKNTGNLTYSNVAVEDETLGEIEKDIEIKPGETKEITKEVIAQSSEDYQFNITGASSSGTDLEMSSNEVSVETLDMGKVVSLEVSADTEALYMYTEPSVVRFAVTVKNVGEIEGKNLKVLCGKTEIATIASLAPGAETTIVKDLAASMAGTFQFFVQCPEVAASEGVEAQAGVTYESNTLRIAYHEPTAPPPTRAPATKAPTLAPMPTAEPIPEKTEAEGSLGFILLCVFAVLLVIALIAVLVLILMGRRKQPAAVVLDSYERANARDYMIDARSRRRGETRRTQPKRESEKRAEKKEEPAQEEAPRGRRARRANAEAEAVSEENQAFKRPKVEEAVVPVVMEEGDDEELFDFDDEKELELPVVEQPEEDGGEMEEAQAPDETAAEEVMAVEEEPADEVAQAMAAAEAAAAEMAENKPLTDAVMQGETVKIDRQMVEQIRREAAEMNATRAALEGKTGTYDLKTLHERMEAEGKVDLSEEKPRRKR